MTLDQPSDPSWRHGDVIAREYATRAATYPPSRSRGPMDVSRAGGAAANRREQ